MNDPAIGRTLVEQGELAARIRELGAEISADYAGHELFLVGVLKGAVFFVADLMRELEIHCAIDFMAVASYGSPTPPPGGVRLLEDLAPPVEGRGGLVVAGTVP